jgi:hypothetical protein
VMPVLAAEEPTLLVSCLARPIRRSVPSDWRAYWRALYSDGWFGVHHSK